MRKSEGLRDGAVCRGPCPNLPAASKLSASRPWPKPVTLLGVSLIHACVPLLPTDMHRILNSIL